mmetsp:Transcript_78143/g.229045  ORF Transcript_78143/g.229045 Transcript_78143/m.229045 type:complete len:374 (-) Transcript_78143:26-1147(-)
MESGQLAAFLHLPAATQWEDCCARCARLAIPIKIHKDCERPHQATLWCAVEVELHGGTRLRVAELEALALALWHQGSTMQALCHSCNHRVLSLNLRLQPPPLHPILLESVQSLCNGNEVTTLFWAQQILHQIDPRVLLRKNADIKCPREALCRGTACWKGRRHAIKPGVWRVNNTLVGAEAEPPLDNPLLALDDWACSMLCPHVLGACDVVVPEEDRPTGPRRYLQRAKLGLCAALLDAVDAGAIVQSVPSCAFFSHLGSEREERLPASLCFVQVDDHGGWPRDVVCRVGVEMELVLLADAVVPNLQCLRVVVRDASCPVHALEDVAQQGDLPLLGGGQPDLPVVPHLRLRVVLVAGLLDHLCRLQPTTCQAL